MNFFLVCFSSAIAGVAIKTSAAFGAGGDVAVLPEAQMSLNGNGNHQLQADPRRLSEAGATPCNAESKADHSPNVAATFSETKLQASFTCGTPYDQGVTPEFTQDAKTTVNCCSNPEDNAGTEIATVLGVQGKAVKDNQTVTVTLEKIPDDKRGQRIYYKCKKASSGFCLVALELPPALGENDCAIDKVITVPLKQTVSSADFKCAGGSMNLEPFEVASGKCSDKKKMSNAAKVTAVDADTGKFKVTVDQRPNQTEELCYTCSYDQVPSLQGENEQTKRTCSVIVNVEAAASSTTTVTTTSSARSIVMTSGAMNLLIAMFLTVSAFNRLTDG